MYIGVDYYPEHWPQRRWATDVAMMKKAGFNVVRLAEFAWVNMEPTEGRFEFGWLDQALDLLRRNGIAAILCTPTATMPAWVAHKYPEVLAQQKDGTRVVWGVRKNNCFSVPIYRQLSERITRAMAEHFARTPNVIGWQTDNEFGCHSNLCYCATCHGEWQRWLRAKYGTLSRLNRAWGTHFWGQRYGAWEEIQIPVDFASHNPSACLDWQRFWSWLNVRFQHEQVAILRKLCPKHFITHNLMGTFPELDYYDLARDLDHVSWDNYPVWGSPEIRYAASYAADHMRGVKNKNFWIMEQTAGPGGWSTFGRNPRPGEIRGVAFQQLARGADGTIWFRWRSCSAGREQYWHGLLQHDGKPSRRYREAAQTAKDFHRLAPKLAGTTLKPEVAMIYDYSSMWATQIQPGFVKNHYQTVQRRYYDALFRAGVNVDLVPPTADLRRYKLVLAPGLQVLPDDLAARLTEYVSRGGVLMADCRTGVKTETNLCHERTLPGRLSATLGIAIEEYEALSDAITYPLNGEGALAGPYTAMQYADWITPRRAEALVKYEFWHLERVAAVTCNRFGKGLAYYVGTIVSEPAFYDDLIAELLARARIRPLVKPPVGVEVTLRKGAGRQLLFLVNHTEESKTVAVPAGKRELLSGKTTGATLQLERHGVAVLQLR